MDKSFTQPLMIASAVFTGLLGIIASFLPQELLTYFNAAATEITILLVKMMGALFVAFALMNWMARANVIGAIYSRPLALGNFMQFFIIALVLLKAVFKTSYPVLLGILCGVNLIFAGSFGYLMFSGKLNEGNPAC